MNNIYINKQIGIDSENYFIENQNTLKNVTLNPMFNSGKMKIDTLDRDHYNTAEIQKKYVTTFIHFNNTNENQYDLTMFIPNNRDFLINIGSVQVTIHDFDKRTLKNIKMAKSKTSKEIPVKDRLRNIKIMSDVFVNMLYYIDFKIKNRNTHVKNIDIVNKFQNDTVNTNSKTNKPQPSNNYIDLDDIFQYLNDGSNNNKSFNRHTESWGVRGHYRNIRDKDGNITKTIFIKPYIKGNINAKLKEKNYILK